ncbi:MAG: 50S ribosomal protein L13 [Phycisphaerales bacterium]
MTRQTYMAKSSDVTPKWRHVDAEGRVLGRMAAEVARVLQGKHRPEWTPHVDTGDFVVITNAEKVVMTGRKTEQRLAKSFTGYPGGLKTRTYGELLEKHPERVVENAVRRMLPKGPLGRQMYSKLKVYRGAEHPHAAQRPEPLEV